MMHRSASQQGADGDALWAYLAIAQNDQRVTIING
jgi:hypothetical protein